MLLAGKRVVLLWASGLAVYCWLRCQHLLNVTVTLGKLFTHTRLCHQAVYMQFGTGSGQKVVMGCDWEGDHRSGRK